MTHNPIRERLAAIGATVTEHVIQTDTYYTAPHRDFETTDEALRTRREELLAEGEEVTRTRITYKGPLVAQESKTRREEETAVEGGETIRSILDVVEELGEFVEIERDAIDEDIEVVREVLRDLGLDPTNHTRTSYPDLQLNTIEQEE